MSFDLTIPESNRSDDERRMGRRRIRGVLVPSEHGGWGLTLEPLIVGLIVAPSVPGLSLAAALLISFLTRRPLRIATRAAPDSDHFRLATTILLAEGIVIAALIGVIIGSGATEAMLPPVIASPLALGVLIGDFRRRSRTLLAELAAASFMACGSIAIAFAGDAPIPVSLALGGLVAARSIGAIVYVREEVRRMKKGKSSSGARLFHFLAFGAVCSLFWVGWTNLLAPLAFLLLLARTSIRTQPRSAKEIGWSEVRVGALFVLLVGFSV